MPLALPRPGAGENIWLLALLGWCLMIQVYWAIRPELWPNGFLSFKQTALSGLFYFND